MDIFDEEVPIDWLAGALDTVRQCTELDFLLVSKRVELWRSRVFEAYKSLCDQIDAGQSKERELCVWLEGWINGGAPQNVWLITSTENQEMFEKRVPELLRIPAAVHGLSCEPLLSPLDLSCFFNEATGSRVSCTDRTGLVLSRSLWVIAGGESGPNSRPCNVDWITEIQRQCKAAGVAYFCKQLGSRPYTENANLNDWPDATPLLAHGTFAAGARIMLSDKKGGDMSEWPEDLMVREWPQVNSRSLNAQQ